MATDAKQKTNPATDNPARSKGTWFHRFAIHLFTIILAILFFWLLGFFVDDIRSVRGPDLGAIETKQLDKALVARRDSLLKMIADLTRQIDNLTEKQRIIRDSSTNLQQTISQLIELQKLGMQKNVSFSESEQANFTSTLNLFLENQKKYQDLGQTMAQMLERKQDLTQKLEQAEAEIERQRQPARQKFQEMMTRHNLKLAGLQLAILVPILLIAVFFILKQRGSIYFPLFLAFGAATLVKVTLVIHAYFPSRYFKYILITALLLVVARLLIYFIRAIAFPKMQWLAKQYREAYERFLCPVCEYPIRIGPRRFLFWTRRTVNRIVVPTDRLDPEEAYICPSCGSKLFENCPSCQKIRHSLMPHCSHCGVEKEIG